MECPRGDVLNYELKILPNGNVYNYIFPSNKKNLLPQMGSSPMNMCRICVVMLLHSILPRNGNLYRAQPTRDSETRWRTCTANETNERVRGPQRRVTIHKKRSKRSTAKNFALNSKIPLDRTVLRGCEMKGRHGSGALWFSASRRRIGAPFCAAGRPVRRVVRVRRRFRRVVSPAPPARF